MKLLTAIILLALALTIPAFATDSPIPAPQTAGIPKKPEALPPPVCNMAGFAVTFSGENLLALWSALKDMPVDTAQRDYRSRLTVDKIIAEQVAWCKAHTNVTK